MPYNIISGKWAAITETYLKPGETVAQLPDLSQMQYGSHEDRQLLHTEETDSQRCDETTPSPFFK